ncbi:MAG: hypothetical protein ABIG95_03780 [Candidatus Woesearchaeota archaeon]
MKQITLMLLVIICIVPLAIAAKPEPLGTSLNPNIIIEQNATEPGSGSGSMQTQEQNTNQVQTQARRQVMVALNTTEALQNMATFRTRTMQILANQSQEKTQLVQNLSVNQTKVLAHLTRAQQKAVMEMAKEQAKLALAKYQLQIINKSRQFKAREITAEVMANVRQRLQTAKDQYTQVREQLKTQKQQFEQAKLEGDQTEATTQAKRYLTKTADLVIKSLEKVQYTVKASEDLTQEEADEIITAIDSEILKMQAAKSEVESAQTKEGVQAAGEQILEAWHVIRLEIKRYATWMIHAKLGEILKRAQNLEDKLDCTIQQMASQKGDVEAIDTKVDEFSMLVLDATTKFKLARTQLIQAKISKSTQIQAEQEIDAAKQQIEGAKQNLVEAHTLLKGIVKSVKEQGFDIAECSDPELAEGEAYEVAEV